MFHCFLVRDQSPGVIIASNRHRFRERRLGGSLNTTLNDRRWPIFAGRRRISSPRARTPGAVCKITNGTLRRSAGSYQPPRVPGCRSARQRRPGSRRWTCHSYFRACDWSRSPIFFSIDSMSGSAVERSVPASRRILYSSNSRLVSTEISDR